MTVLVLGGDTRQIYCAGGLSLEKGMKVMTCGLGSDEREVKNVDVLVLPYVSLIGDNINAPLSHREIPFQEALSFVNDGTIVFGGMLPEDKTDLILECGGKYFDWFSFEELTLKNAKLTAEGAAQLIVKNSPNALGGSNILLLGWGRVAKACAELFLAMGASVSVAARSDKARKEATLAGFKAYEFIDPQSLAQADIVVNTVPKVVLTEERLKSMKQGSWILELASKPYGVDFDLANSLGIKTVLGSGLPGKYTPELAGRYMAQTVKKVILGGGNGG